MSRRSPPSTSRLSTDCSGNENGLPTPNSPGRAGKEIPAGSAICRRSSTRRFSRYPCASTSAQVDEVDLLLQRLGSLGVVSLDEDEAVLVECREVADDRVRERRVGPVPPRLSRCTSVEAMSNSFRMRRRGSASAIRAPSSIGYSVLPSMLSASGSKPRLARRVGAPEPRNGFCGDCTPGSGIGASSTFPVASVCRRNGPNSSPNQKVPSFARRTASRSKSAPVRRRSERTSANGTFESGSRSWRNEMTSHRPRAACGGLEVRADAVEPKQEVGGVRLRAVPVVRHGPELAVSGVEHRREAGDRLSRETGSRRR